MGDLDLMEAADKFLVSYPANIQYKDILEETFFAGAQYARKELFSKNDFQNAVQHVRNFFGKEVEGQVFIDMNVNALWYELDNFLNIVKDMRNGNN